MVDNTTQKLILGFVALILGAVLIGQIASSGNLVTDKKIITNEAITITKAFSVNSSGYIGSINETTNQNRFQLTNYPTSWKTTDCPVTSFVLSNASKDLTLTTDYVTDLTQGYFWLNNSNNVNGSSEYTAPITTLYADYIYCADDYLNQSFGRSAIDVTMGLFAIGILGVAVGLFYSVAKDTNLI